MKLDHLLGVRSTFQLNLRINSFAVAPEKLCAAKIWCILRNSNKFYLLAEYFIGKIEQLVDNDIVEGYLLEADIGQSIWATRFDSENNDYSVNDIEGISTLTPGFLHELNDRQKNILESKIHRNVVRITPPVVDKFIVDLPTIYNDSPIKLFNWIVGKMKRQYPLEDIYRFSKYPTHWSPYECYAYHYIEVKLPHLKTIIFDLLTEKEKVGSVSILDRGSHKEFDSDFTKIDSNNIKVRRFIGSSENMQNRNWSVEMAKLDRAESAHQNILKDVTIFLNSRGITAYESSSIDMFIPGGHADAIIEIKSSTVENFDRQTTHGAIQLKEYCYCYKSESQRIILPLLIVENINNDDSKKYYSGFLKDLGITLLIYNGSISWPDRIQGFQAIVENIGHRHYAN